MTIDRYVDCHMHSEFSDGRTSIGRLAETAVEKGLAAIAVTDHMPLPFLTRYAMEPNRLHVYRDEISQTREAYAHVLDIRSGLEMEYLPDHRAWIERIARMDWDIRLISIHGMEKGDRHFMVNGREDEFRRTLKEVFYSDIRAFCTHYYEMLTEAVRTGWFDAAGHLDVIKKHNKDQRYFDETASWYKDLVRSALDAIAENDMKLEINTNGLNHPAGAFYPSAWIVREAREKGIPIILGSDAHSPEYIGQYFDRVEPL